MASASDRPARTLILGGARSGKSAYAEALVTEYAPVRYVATALPHAEDRDFAARVATHRERRPADWHTVENSDLADILAEPATGATLVDDLGTWLTARIDARAAWDAPPGTIAADTDRLVTAVADFPARLVIVSPEVGMGVIPATRSGRLFRDEIGALNQRLAAVCDEAYLVVAGLPLRLK
nr:bifunctional adenosylcobinamide kinase/adenosylcobinamide-phosphate guanylyltransferase [Nocardia arizonensis]